MFTGAHVMVQSRNPTADKAFFGGVLKLPSVDAGGGFLIFGVPPAEIAIHDSDNNGVHQLYLMCNDAAGFVSEMKRLGIACTAPTKQRWGTLFEITLPGGGKLGVYEPNYPRPESAAAKKTRIPEKRKRATAKRVSPARRKTKKRR